MKVDRLKKLSTPIFVLISTNKLFNGFGANHTTEALHYAGIHPMTSSAEVFSSSMKTKRLLGGLHDASRLPPNWSKYITKHFDQMEPFKLSKSGWIYYESCVNKVYKKKSVLVPKAWFKVAKDPQLMKVQNSNSIFLDLRLMFSCLKGDRLQDHADFRRNSKSG